MSCTRRTASRPFDATRRSAFDVHLLLRALACLNAAAAGCAGGGELALDFDLLKPASVAVLPVKNETVFPLDQVAFGGLFQRATLGARIYDVPQSLKAAIEEAVARRGYALAPPPGGKADYSRPAPPEAPRPGVDAVLESAIESWNADTLGAGGFAMRYRLLLYRVPGGERLFSGTFYCEERPEPRSRGADDLEASFRRSTRVALASLPRAD